MADRRGLTFEEFEVGCRYESQARTVTETDIVTFAGLSGDFNPLHTDAEFATGTPFGERIAHGMLIAAISTGMANWTGVFEGTTLALLEQIIRYKGITRIGDTVHLQLEVLEKTPSSKPDRGVVKFATRMLNQNDQLVLDGEWTLLMKRREGGD